MSVGLAATFVLASDARFAESFDVFVDGFFDDSDGRCDFGACVDAAVMDDDDDDVVDEDDIVGVECRYIVVGSVLLSNGLLECLMATGLGAAG